MPRSAGQIPIFYNHKIGSGYSVGAEGTNEVVFSGGYTDGAWTPLYPFGYGLSYTSFALSGLSVLPEKEVPLTLEGKVCIRCQVSNTGTREGDEVVQLYTAFCDAHVSRPNKQLAGFKRVSLQLGFYNEEMEFVVEPGRLELMVGTSSEELPLRTAVTLTGQPLKVMGKRSYVCKTEVKCAV